MGVVPSSSRRGQVSPAHPMNFQLRWGHRPSFPEFACLIDYHCSSQISSEVDFGEYKILFKTQNNLTNSILKFH